MIRLKLTSKPQVSDPITAATLLDIPDRKVYVRPVAIRSVIRKWVAINFLMKLGRCMKVASILAQVITPSVKPVVIVYP